MTKITYNVDYNVRLYRLNYQNVAVKINNILCSPLAVAKWSNFESDSNDKHNAITTQQVT